jgi:hypothetical protein
MQHASRHIQLQSGLAEAIKKLLVADCEMQLRSGRHVKERQPFPQEVTRAFPISDVNIKATKLDAQSAFRVSGSELRATP